MEIREAVEADAERMAELSESPPDVMRNLVHDRTVRVATTDDEVVGFVSFDARDSTVHVTQIGGSRKACEQLIEEPIRFAKREGMTVEVLLPEDENETRAAIESAGFEDDGTGPQFDGRSTTRYHLAPGRARR
ncbi:hypothetical protein BRC91_00515 [Halobacteriales archaeon QS_4_62_28]|nr:MAG: hypothetical protein BRC91_00515 [Halobacteriales archaeon QS_4_62_28]